MSHLRQNDIDDLLSNIAEVLDIPDHYHEDAVRAYEDIGGHLSEADSPLHDYSPEIYPQGSFRLGTVVRPHLKEDEYDIDLVCCLKIKKESTTQKDLKKNVGDRLKSRSDLKAKLDEMGRCWRLSYAQQFHMDVLPVIPDLKKPKTGILLTDRDLTLWQESDPIAYAEWFYERMKPAADQKRAAMAAAKQASIEEVPEWQVRTPLQRAVQLLKRHRDIYFGDNFDDRTTSIVITTLAAHAYNNQTDISETLCDVVCKMASYIEKRKNVWWLENPVQSGENFADKWNAYPERREKFEKWLAQAERDFIGAIETKSVKAASEQLIRSLGHKPVHEAAIKLGMALQVPTARSTPFAAPQVPSLANADHCERLRLPEHAAYKATIKAGVFLKKWGSKQLWPLSERPVPKRMGIKFTLTTNAKPPFDVWWQVVNTGKEAIEARSLRGNFEESSELVRWEETAYAGTHWVEGFVIKNGMCVARSGKTYVKVR